MSIPIILMSLLKILGFFYLSFFTVDLMILIFYGFLLIGTLIEWLLWYISCI